MATRRSRRNSAVSAVVVDGENVPSTNEAPAARTRSTSRPARTPSQNSNCDNTQRLRELPKIPPRPTTPLRRASSADPIPGQRSIRRTPAGPTSLRKATGNTPHARAAMREIELRRAAVLTPGRDRRRSLGRQQKETPMAAMRALSKLLAPKTKPPTPSPPQAELPGPKSSKRRRIADDFDDFDEEVPARPRLSMALDDYDEDDSLILPPPPRSSGLEDENYTARSIEAPRRAASEQVGSRFSRGSFGSIRSDDRIEAFGTFNFNALGEEGLDSSFIAQDDYRDDTDENRRYSGIPREDTGTVQLDVPDDVARRMSDFRRAALHNDDSDTSFMIAVPPRDDIPENMLKFGAEEMEDLPFDAVEETPVRQQNVDSGIFVAMGDEQNLALDDDDEPEEEEEERDDEEEERELEAEQDLGNEELEAELANENENPNQKGNDTMMTEENQDDTTILVAISKRKKKPIKISKHGIPVPSLPMGVVKKLATNYARTSGNSKAKLSKDALAAIMQASDWFFEQAAGDLGAYSEHAKRKTIDESDVVTLMKRQRQVNATMTPFALAQKYLPRELLQDLRMAAPPKLKRKRLDALREEEEGDEG